MDDLVTAWINFSDMDLTAAKHLYETLHPVPSEIVCYHCQQSAEKILKAFLIYSGSKPAKVHDLELLRSACDKLDKSFIEIAEECVRLNDYSSQPRYPMEIEVMDSDTLLALQDSQKISCFVKNRL
jgi:HEPN domain-containing protein